MDVALAEPMVLCEGVSDWSGLTVVKPCGYVLCNSGSRGGQEQETDCARPDTWSDKSRLGSVGPVERSM
ncbi:hypothetical protein BaRGS_00027521 [Batillaria attramentaria]|uniref:Uncharacterized protein n=1 Tax=Batillaria attramentaria TaxID=370345 RepID=A0ABD0K301_9CAEN